MMYIYDKDVVLIFFFFFQVFLMLEICFVFKIKFVSQYFGLYIFISIVRMIRFVWNFVIDCKEWIGIFEQVYMDICIIFEEVI